MKNNIKILIKYLGYLILIILISSYLISSYKVRRGEEYLPTVMGYTGVTIKTGSMSPVAKVGDYVVIKKPKINEIKEGDIITFLVEDILVTHRVEFILVDNDVSKYLTKGDANNTTDEILVQFKNIVGKSVIVIPKLGYIFSFMTSTIGLLIIGLLMVIMFLLPNDKKNKKAGNTQENICKDK